MNKPWTVNKQVQQKYDSNTGQPTTWTFHWILDSKGERIANSLDGEMFNAKDEESAVAAHIVKCVNMHEELLEALKQANQVLKDLARAAHRGAIPDPIVMLGLRTEALIAKAEGE